MTLRTKLLSIQAPFFVAIVMMSFASMYSITELGAKSQEILQDNYRSVLAAQRMDEAVERLDDAAMLLLLNDGDPAKSSNIGKHVETFESELAVENANITEPGEAELASKVGRDWTQAIQLFSEMKKITGHDKLKEFYEQKLQPKLAAVRTGTGEILGINQDAMVRKSDRALAHSGKLQVFIITSWIIAAAFALTIAWGMTKRLIKPISSLQSAVKRIGEGDLEVRATPEGKDEIALLANDFNAMAATLQQYRRSSLGELLRAQQASQASMDSLPEPVLLFGKHRELLSYNQSAGKLFGDFESINDLDVTLAQAINKVLDHVLGGSGPYISRGLEETVRFRGQEMDHYLLPTANPLRDEDGTAIGVTIGLQDVTRFKRFDELKDDMVSTVAHEFRTPLTSIRMAIHICLEEIVGPLTAKQSDMLSVAREECDRLQTLVDDLLDLSRLQTGITPTSPEPILADTLIQNAIARRLNDAEKKEISLKRQSIGPGTSVLADESRIATVFDNLINNALRYSPKGSEITVRATQFESSVKFEIVDRGPGIPKQHLEHLFERMYQVPGAESGARGLGLYIVREIVLAHGGEVGVESEPGSGSTFWFTLNMEKSA